MANVYNHSKLAFHKEKLEALAKGEVSAPIYVRVKPTNKCNHRCFYCSYDPDFEYILSERLKRNDEIPEKKMMEILDDFRDIGVKAVTYSGGGEPLIYPYINKTLEKTLENRIDLSIITNGQKLDGRRAELLTQAKWVRVSADYCDEKTFSRIRRVPKVLFHKLVDNLRNFAERKNPDCEFGINFVINGKNFDRIYESARFFKELGVNHIKFSPLYTPRGFLEYHAPFKERVIEEIKRTKELEDTNFAIYSTYENDFKLAGVDERKYSRCFMMETVPVIAADSVIYFCHDKAYAETGILGSIKDKSFREVWFSEEAAKIFRNFDAKKICRHHCTGDCRNISIQTMINDLGNLGKYLPKSDKHKNFI